MRIHYPLILSKIASLSAGDWDRQYASVGYPVGGLEHGCQCISIGDGTCTSSCDKNAKYTMTRIPTSQAPCTNCNRPESIVVEPKYYMDPKKRLSSYSGVLKSSSKNMRSVYTHGNEMVTPIVYSAQPASYYVGQQPVSAAPNIIFEPSLQTQVGAASQVISQAYGTGPQVISQPYYVTTQQVVSEPQSTQVVRIPVKVKVGWLDKLRYLWKKRQASKGKYVGEYSTQCAGPNCPGCPTCSIPGNSAPMIMNGVNGVNGIPSVVSMQPQTIQVAQPTISTIAMNQV